MKLFFKTLIMLLFLINFYPLKFEAAAIEENKIVAELNLLGEKNFIVYTVPNQQIESENLSKLILEKLETHYEIQSFRVENFSDRTDYTYFFEQFIDGNRKDVYRIALDYEALLSSFHSTRLIDFTIVGSKLLEVNFPPNGVKFIQKNTFLSDQQWRYVGSIEDIVNIDQILEVSVHHEKFRSSIIMYIGLVIVSVCLCFILASNFKNNAILKNIKSNEVRQYSYKYQIVPFLFYIVAIIYCICSGLITALLTYYGNAFGTLFIFLPILIVLIMLISTFIPAEKEVIRVLENKERVNSRKAVYFSFIPMLITISLSISNIAILELIPWDRIEFIADDMMFYVKNALRIFVLTTAFLVSPILYNILLPKKELKQNALKQKIQDLCTHFDIRFEKIYIVSSKDTYMANAMVSSGLKNYLYLYDHLIDHLTDKELEAVILHEIAHIRNKHTSKLFIAAISLFLIFRIFLYFFPQLLLILLVLYFGMLCLLIPFLMRKYEYEADLFVIRNGGSSEALKNTLIKLTELNYMQQKTKGLRKWIDTHPSVFNRIEHINMDISEKGFKCK